MQALIKALVAARKDIGAAKKGSVNPHFRSKYADLGNVMEAIKEPMEAHGLAFVQTIDNNCVVTVILHESGEAMHLAPFPIIATKADAQGHGSALTYARRYSLQTALGVPAEDDDGNAAVRAPVISPVKESLKGEDYDPAKVTLIVDTLRGYLAEPGKEYNVFEEVEGLTDGYKLAVWNALGSSERSRIKKIQADMRATKQ
jgi:hypothetical protein